MLEEEHRVVVADRLLEQALGIARRGRAGDLEPGHRVEPADRRLRVDRAEAAARPDDREHHERHAGLLVREVPVLRALVDDAVHHERQEVAEHDLDHGPLAGHGAAEGRADQRELGDRRVEHARLAVFLGQPGVVTKTPPATAMSSPNRITFSSRASSSSRASRTAVRNSTAGIADRAHKTRTSGDSRSARRRARNAAPSAP